MDTDFTEINKENKYKGYIFVIVLYVIVIILFVFLVLGLKIKKNTVLNEIDNYSFINNSKAIK